MELAPRAKQVGHIFKVDQLCFFYFSGFWIPVPCLPPLPTTSSNPALPPGPPRPPAELICIMPAADQGTRLRPVCAGEASHSHRPATWKPAPAKHLLHRRQFVLFLAICWCYVHQPGREGGWQKKPGPTGERGRWPLTLKIDRVTWAFLKFDMRHRA